MKGNAMPERMRKMITNVISQFESGPEAMMK
jgi:hypothetical protein